MFQRRSASFNILQWSIAGGFRKDGLSKVQVDVRFTVGAFLFVVSREQSGRSKLGGDLTKECDIQRVPRIRLLRGEHNREFILTPAGEVTYLTACPFPRADIARCRFSTPDRASAKR